MSKFDDIADGGDEFLHLIFTDDKRGRNFQHHEVIAANLSENAVIPEHAHDDNLSEHCRMNAHERFKRDTQLKLLRGAEFNPEKKTFAANFLDHFETRERCCEPVAKLAAGGKGAIAQALCFEYFKRGQPRPHG